MSESAWLQFGVVNSLKKSAVPQLVLGGVLARFLG